jgi:hypothetical protein
MKAHSRSGVLKSKREEKAICEFTDTELEYLVNKILVED